MDYKKYGTIVLFILWTAALIPGCATNSAQSEWDPYKLIWPLPPEKPRIKYVDSLRSSMDVNKPGLVETLFGEVGGISLLKPYSVTSDENGRVYVSDIGKIFVFDKAGKKLTLIGNSGLGKVYRPLGMFYERQNRLLYVADSVHDAVLVFRPDGKPVMEIGKRDELRDPGGVAVDISRKRVYVANTKKHVISVFSTEGRFIEDLGTRGDGDGELNFPTQIDIDSKGNLYVVDTGNFRVQVLDPHGGFIRKMGELGSRIGQFARPKGIAIGKDDVLYVTDSMFHGVTMFDKEGRLLLGWGARGWDKGLFDLPAGIHVDDKGLVYVVSQWTARVDIFQYISYPGEQEAAKEEAVKEEAVKEEGE